MAVTKLRNLRPRIDKSYGTHKTYATYPPCVKQLLLVQPPVRC